MKVCRSALLALSVFVSSITAYPAFADGPSTQSVLMVDEREHVIGDPKAPVTVIQYASLTCPQCRKFHVTAWPDVKARLVDKGKVRFVIREFPLDSLALGGFMLSNCVGAARWSEAVDKLYRSEALSTRVEDPVAGLHEIMHGMGMDSRAFENCLTDQAGLDHVNMVKQRGEEAGVKATPTFFIGTQRVEGFVTSDEFAQLVEKELPR